MRFFLDTEFNEDGRTIDLISIALVAENGQEFYRQNAQADLRRVNAWVAENVVPQLWGCPKNILGPRHMYGLCADPACVWRPKRLIRDELFKFVNEQCILPEARLEPKPEFWGYYADYDWVVLCQLFGAMIALPSGWPMYCRDLKQLSDMWGVELYQSDTDSHNALTDARWNRAAYDQLITVHRRARDAWRQVTGSVDQEPEAVRSTEEEGHVQVSGSGDLERLGEQVRQEGTAAEVSEESVTFV